jgi:hypothetical protein
MSQYIKLLSDLSFTMGLIGLPEYLERNEVADWLEDSSNGLPDPRISSNEFEEINQEDHSLDENANREEVQSQTGKASDYSPPCIELLMMNQWMFTIGDVDCYPSVPHGHFKSKTREWPKLNPYIGRVFSDVHKEDTNKRLSKKDMIKLWNDPKFIEHCREQVNWYSGFSPRYGFPRAKRGKLAFPKWR